MKSPTLLCVPASAISGEPEPGTTVTVSVRASVEKVEEGEIYLKPVTVNGEALLDTHGEDSSDDNDDAPSTQRLTGWGQSVLNSINQES